MEKSFTVLFRFKHLRSSAVYIQRLQLPKRYSRLKTGLLLNFKSCCTREPIHVNFRDRASTTQKSIPSIAFNFEAVKCRAWEDWLFLNVNPR